MCALARGVLHGMPTQKEDDTISKGLKKGLYQPDRREPKWVHGDAKEDFGAHWERVVISPRLSILLQENPPRGTPANVKSAAVGWTIRGRIPVVASEGEKKR